MIEPKEALATHASNTFGTQSGRRFTVAQDHGLTLTGLEAVYDALAEAIDQAGTEKTELFLVKLALLNAQALADEHVFKEQLQKALKDL